MPDCPICAHPDPTNPLHGGGEEQHYSYAQRLALDSEQSQQHKVRTDSPQDHSIRINDRPGSPCKDCRQATSGAPVGYRKEDVLCSRCFELSSPALGSILALTTAARVCANVFDHSFATEPLAIITEQLGHLRQMLEQSKALRDRASHGAQFDEETDAPINEQAHVHSNLAILIDDEITPAVRRLERLLTLMESNEQRGGHE